MKVVQGAQTSCLTVTHRSVTEEIGDSSIHSVDVRSRTVNKTVFQCKLNDTMDPSVILLTVVSPPMLRHLAVVLVKPETCLVFIPDAGEMIADEVPVDHGCLDPPMIKRVGSGFSRHPGFASLCFVDTVQRHQHRKRRQCQRI